METGVSFERPGNELSRRRGLLSPHRVPDHPKHPKAVKAYSEKQGKGNGPVPAPLMALPLVLPASFGTKRSYAEGPGSPAPVKSLVVPAEFVESVGSARMVYDSLQGLGPAVPGSSASNMTSQYRGVWRNPTSQSTKWMARIHIKGKKKSLGVFDTEEDAARAYVGGLGVVVGGGA